MNRNLSEISIIVDSGSTKTDWCLCGNGRQICRIATQGINPVHQSADEISKIIAMELLPSMAGKVLECGFILSDVGRVEFYGAGCRGEGIETMRQILSVVFSGTTHILVGSDLLAAAHAVFAGEEGIACILGTGANSGLYDGKEIVENVSPLGYILGDEGSGAVLGKLFINELFKGDMPTAVREEFLKDSELTLDEIINKVYRQPLANRFLASLSKYIYKYIDEEKVENLVIRNFEDFFHRNIDHYDRRDLCVGAVGSIAYYYKSQLEKAANRCGYKLGRVEKAPLDGLLQR